ncbi:MAG: P-loop NTPase fold protein [Phycisphaerae bacterium]|jgi:hypothetical protein
MAENNYKFLDDRPTTQDRIGHFELIADELYNTARSDLKKPFVIGLFGSWGTGKSSIIKLLEGKCKKEKEKTKVITVDAWRKDKDIFNRQFLKKIARELFDDNSYKDIKKKIDEKNIVNKSKWEPSKIAWWLFGVFVFLLLASSALSGWGWLKSKEVINPFPWLSVMGSFVGILIACYFQIILPRFSITTSTQTDDVSLQDIDYFRDIYFNEIISKAKEKHICIVIDNLDRVEPEDTLAIIKTLKTFIVDAKEDNNTKEAVDKDDLDKVVFIIPCCDQELRRHFNNIEQHPGTLDPVPEKKDNGKDFLEKFFNVSVRIPEFRSQDAFRYAQELYRDMKLDFSKDHRDIICHIIKVGFGKNPRKAKIFLNNFLIKYNLAKSCEEAGKIKKGIITQHPDCLAIDLAKEDMGDYYGRLKNRITSECAAAITYLKTPNDFDKIEGLYELYNLAYENNEQFAKSLSGRLEESQDIINAIWNNTDASDSIGRVNAISSVMAAIELNDKIAISSTTADQMALSLSSQNPNQLPKMPGKIVYQRILKGKPDEVLRVIENLGKPINGIEYTKEQIRYSVDVFGSILEDNQILLSNKQSNVIKLKQEIPQTIERLAGLYDEIVPIAIKYPDFKSKTLFSKSLKRVNEGYFDVLPDNVVEYCMALENIAEDNTQHIKNVIQCFNKALGYFKNEEKWDVKTNKEIEINSEQCVNFLKALRSINARAYEHNMLPADSEAVLQTLNQLFDYVDDKNKLEIIDTYGDYENFKKWSGTMRIATDLWNSKGNKLLSSGSEQVINKFIEKNSDLINTRLSQNINTAGSRYKSICLQVLDVYAGRRRSIVSELWKNKSDWVGEWIKNNASKMDKEQKRELQDTLFSIANSSGYPIDVYQTLSYLKVGNHREAVETRNEHFNKLIQSEGLSTIDRLEFVLERIDKASYQTTDEQNDLLNKGWREIDQRTAGSNLKRLVEKVIRI